MLLYCISLSILLGIISIVSRQYALDRPHPAVFEFLAEGGDGYRRALDWCFEWIVGKYKPYFTSRNPLPETIIERASRINI
jgi:hypothetical protein